MKCTKCHGEGFFPLTAWHIDQMMDCSDEARRCPVCNGLGIIVERLPYQGKTQPTKLKKRRDIDIFDENDICDWANGDRHWDSPFTDNEKEQMGIPLRPWRKSV